MSNQSTVEPILLSHLERVALQQLDLALSQAGSAARSVSVADTSYVLPDVVWDALRDVVHEVALGNAVTVAPTAAELTTQQAAAMLHVSRPHLIQLLEAGRIPFRKVGTHRRIARSDVLAFQVHEKARQREAIEHLVELSLEAGLDI